MSQNAAEVSNSREKYPSYVSGYWVLFSAVELFALSDCKQRDIFVGRRNQGKCISHVGYSDTTESEGEPNT